MSVKTQKYVRKPLYVDAVRVTHANFEEIADWCQGTIETADVEGEGAGGFFIKVRVQNPKHPRQTKAFIGDWILYTERGYKVYTNKAFRAAFDLAAEIEKGDLSDPELTGDPVTDADAEVREKISAGNGKFRRDGEKIVPDAAAGKRVLSVEDQNTLSHAEVRDLLQSGEAVLVQDLAHPIQ